MMECKKALTEANGDIAEGEVVLRKRGIASAGKKASRSTMQGMVGTYIHAGAQLHRASRSPAWPRSRSRPSPATS